MQWRGEIVGGSTLGFMTNLRGCSRRRKAAGWKHAFGHQRRKIPDVREGEWREWTRGRVRFLSIIDWSRKKSRLWWIQTRPTTFAYSTRTTPHRGHSVRVVEATGTPPPLCFSLRGKRVIDPEKEIRIHSTSVNNGLPAPLDNGLPIRNAAKLRRALLNSIAISIAKTATKNCLTLADIESEREVYWKFIRSMPLCVSYISLDRPWNCRNVTIYLINAKKSFP